MTQEGKPITRGALELRKRLQELGSIHQQEVRDWLPELDLELTASDINFVIGYGLNPKRLWWHENAEGFLVNGPAPGTNPAPSSRDRSGQVPVPLSDEVKKLVVIDTSTMSDPRERFYVIALNLGIAEKAARSTACYCFGTADMYDPTEAWQALVQGSDIMPSQKRRLWRLWCYWAGLGIPQALSEKVDKQYPVLGSTDRPKDFSVPPAPARRFIPVRGEVVMVDPDDPGGMSFSEALQVADRQMEKLELSTRT
jgi:hypothetical protein